MKLLFSLLVTALPLVIAGTSYLYWKQWLQSADTQLILMPAAMVTTLSAAPGALLLILGLVLTFGTLVGIRSWHKWLLLPWPLAVFIAGYFVISYGTIHASKVEWKRNPRLFVVADDGASIYETEYGSYNMSEHHFWKAQNTILGVKRLTPVEEARLDGKVVTLWERNWAQERLQRTTAIEGTSFGEGFLPGYPFPIPETEPLNGPIPPLFGDGRHLWLPLDPNPESLLAKAGKAPLAPGNITLRTESGITYLDVKIGEVFYSAILDFVESLSEQRVRFQATPTISGLWRSRVTLSRTRKKGIWCWDNLPPFGRLCTVDAGSVPRIEGMQADDFDYKEPWQRGEQDWDPHPPEEPDHEVISMNGVELEVTVLEEGRRVYSVKPSTEGMLFRPDGEVVPTDEIHGEPFWLQDTLVEMEQSLLQAHIAAQYIDGKTHYLLAFPSTHAEVYSWARGEKPAAIARLDGTYEQLSLYASIDGFEVVTPYQRLRHRPGRPVRIDTLQASNDKPFGKPGYAPHLSPDGNRLVWAMQGPNDDSFLRVQELESNQPPRTLFRQAGVWYIDNFSFSPDGSRLFFENIGNQRCIWVYEFESETVTKIIPEHDAREPFAYDAPDGPHIVFLNENFVIDAHR